MGRLTGVSQFHLRFSGFLGPEGLICGCDSEAFFALFDCALKGSNYLQELMGVLKNSWVKVCGFAGLKMESRGTHFSWADHRWMSLRFFGLISSGSPGLNSDQLCRILIRD
jgi:hypothetical protein